MINRAFRYDLNSGVWVEIEDKNFIDTDIEKLPVALVVSYEWIKNRNFLFCRKHRRVEEIISVTDSEIITDENCTFKGLTTVVKIPKNESYDWRNHFVAVRWRIFQKSPQTPVNVSADVISFKYKGWHNIFLCHYENFYINVSIAKKTHIIKKIKDCSGRFVNWTEELEIKIPKIVAENALEVLRESTKIIYGIKPSDITKFDIRKKFLTYFERPFDLNIVFLKNFFIAFGEFDEIFPYDCTDNYKIICRLLEINPPKSLRKAYAKNPYAIIWYMLFMQWGVKDLNFIQKFFYFDEYFVGMPLNKFVMVPEIKRVATYVLSWIEKWLALENYCKWLLKEKGEKFMMNWLYKINEKGILNWQVDILHQFRQYGDKLPEEIKKLLLKEGLTNYVHDIISWKVRELSENLTNVRVIYTPNILKYEAIINGYEFRLVRDTKTLYFVSLELENCVMSYRDKVLSRQSIIFCVIRKAKYIACIEIQNGNEIVQALGYHNQLLEGELLFICNFWAQLKNLKISTEQLNLPIKIIFKDIFIPKNLQNLICKIISE